MALRTLKTITIIALAGTSLSSCALIGGAADGAWSGTKYVAKVVSYPVRAILRDAPAEETQFAAAETDTASEASAASETKQVRAPDMDGEIEMMAETVVEVKSSKVMGATSAAMPVPADSRWAMKTPQTAQVQIGPNTPVKTETMGSQAMAMKTASQTQSSQTSYSQSPVRIIETVAVSDSQSMDVVTVGNVSWMRTDGAGSLEDWRTCDIQSGGFWSFDTAGTSGMLNPKFENCMRSKNYVRDMGAAKQRMAELATTQSAPTVDPLP